MKQLPNAKIGDVSKIVSNHLKDKGAGLSLASMKDVMVSELRFFFQLEFAICFDFTGSGERVGEKPNAETVRCAGCGLGYCQIVLPRRRKRFEESVPGEIARISKLEIRLVAIHADD